MGKAVQLNKIGSCIKLFISENGGRFPAGKRELIKRGYLTLNSDVDGEELYEVRKIQGINNDWSADYFRPKYEVIQGCCLYLDRFKVNYDVKFEDLKLVDDIIIDIKTGKPILLIDGPTNFSFTSYYLPKRYYMFASCELYKEMEYREKMKGEVEYLNLSTEKTEE